MTTIHPGLQPTLDFVSLGGDDDFDGHIRYLILFMIASQTNVPFPDQLIAVLL